MGLLIALIALPFIMWLPPKISKRMRTDIHNAKLRENYIFVYGVLMTQCRVQYNKIICFKMLTVFLIWIILLIK